MKRFPRGRQVISCQPQDEDGFAVWCSIDEAQRNDIKVYLDGELVPYAVWLSADEWIGIVRYVDCTGIGQHKEKRGKVRISLPGAP